MQGEESEIYFDDLSNLDGNSDIYSLAAKQLGLTIEALFSEIELGKSSATLAQEKGLDTQIIVEAALKQESAMLDALVNNGELSREKRNADLKKLHSLVEFEVAYVSIDPVIWFTKHIGASEDDIWNQVEQGQPLNEIVTQAVYDTVTVVKSLQGRLLEDDQAWVKAGLMEQEEAAIKAELYQNLMPGLFNLHINTLRQLWYLDEYFNMDLDFETEYECFNLDEENVTVQLPN